MTSILQLLYNTANIMGLIQQWNERREQQYQEDCRKYWENWKKLQAEPDDFYS